MKRLRDALADGCVLLDVPHHDLASVLRAAINFAVGRKWLASDKMAEVEEQLLALERRAPTAIGNAVAIPHLYSHAFKEAAIVLVRLAHPLNLGAPDGIATRFVFVLFGPPRVAEEHLDSLANIARMAADDEFRYDATVARGIPELIEALDRFTHRNAPEAPAAPVQDDGLHYTGKLFGGILADVRRRAPHYLSDYLDGLNSKALAAVLFLLFACLAPAVTFGGIMAELTNNQIGVVEMLVATALCGVLYAVAAGQPLILLGGTGPLLVFTWVLFVLCQQLGLEEHFLETYTWVGLWTALLLLVMSATEASCLMRYVTRFTDETFGALMSIIFIYTAIKALAGTVSEVYNQETAGHDEALVPLLLSGGTFFIALTLARFRRSRYLLPPVREFFADFGPAIAIALMTWLAVAWFYDVDTKSLSIRAGLSPSIERAWLINPLAAPRWVWFASLVPAALAALLIYIVQNVTARLINNPQNRLKKGPAYHLDLAVLGLLVAVCSLFGLPWFVAATVRSLNQFRSLAKIEAGIKPDGSSRERVLHVCETRVTALAIHLLIAASLAVLALLRFVPMAVLYGLFLYMGVVSMAGNQFFERLGLLVTDPSLYPSTHYLRRVPNRMIHLFTVIQLVCLVVLTVVGFTSFAILLPLLLVLLVPIRQLIARWIPEPFLKILDEDEEPEAEETHWT